MIHITKGDVLDVDVNCVIVHCCNNVGAFGSGIAGNIRKKYLRVAQAYEDWYNGNYTDRTTQQGKTITHLKKKFDLGEIQIVEAEEGKKNKLICNLIGQKSVGIINCGDTNIPPIYYSAIYEGMLRLRHFVKCQHSLDNKIEVLSPLLGCGLAGGSLERIYAIVAKVFGNEKINYTFYAFTDEDYNVLKQVHSNYQSAMSPAAFYSK